MTNQHHCYGIFRRSDSAGRKNIWHCQIVVWHCWVCKKKEYDLMDISSITGYYAFWKVLLLYCEAHVFTFVFWEFDFFVQNYFASILYAQTYNMHSSGREQQLLSTCCHINMAMANCWLCYIKSAMTQHRDKRCWVARGSHPRFHSNSFLLALLVRQHVLPMYKNMKHEIGVHKKGRETIHCLIYTYAHAHHMCTFTTYCTFQM